MDVRRWRSALFLLALVVSGLALVTPPASAADTGNSAPQSGRVVSDEPGKNAPNILDGTVYSITQVGNTIVVGGQFTQVQNYNTSAVLTRNNVFAFDATTGKISTTFAPEPSATVYKVQASTDGQVYIAGKFTSAGGVSRPSRLIKANVTTGAVDPTFAPPTISGDIRDLEVVGNRLWVAGKFTHLGSNAQKALGTLNATTGKYDAYFTGVMAGLHRATSTTDITNVLQISSNAANTRLMAVGNFTSVNGAARSQIAQFDISGSTTYALSPWATAFYTSSCSSKFETYMSDVEYSPKGDYFAVSTSGAWGGLSSATAGNGCDVVARFESSSTSATSAPVWTAYTGGDTTWTVEVTDDVIYAGGHQNWQNNPIGKNVPGQGAVSREGIAALNPVNGMPLSWNPTRARGVGVQDMLATETGLYVGSDTTLIGHTPGNTYHARIAVLPLAGGGARPTVAASSLPADVYTVPTGGSALTRRAFSGTAVTGTSAVPTGPGWSSAAGAFMVNGVLYKANTDGSVTKQTFDGTAYGAAEPVSTSDALVYQSDWHTDVQTITTLFYAEGRIYYTKSGTNALYRRGFEIEDDVVGQQRFSTTTSGINWSSVRGAFVTGGKLYYATTGGQLYSATWNQAAHAPVAGTSVLLSGAGTGWASRAMFVGHAAPLAPNEAPFAAATVTCDQLTCTYDASGSSDPEGATLSYDWDFGDATTHGTTATLTHTYATGGDRPVTLTVTDDRGAVASVTRTASPVAQADPITFVAKANTNGNRADHTVTVPSGTQVGDTLLLFFAANSVGPVYAGPSGWQEVLSQNGTSMVGRLYARTATAADLGTTVKVTSRNPDGSSYTVRDDMTLAAYRGIAPVLGAAAASAQNVATAVHQTPTVNAADGTGWLVSFWADKSSSTTSWAAPDGQSQRSMGNATGTSHVSSLLADSGRRVGTGPQGGLNATADSSAQGLTMSLVLPGAAPPPANGAPVAQARLVGCTDLACSFDAAASSDPDGDPLTYDWDWGDTSTHGSGPTPTHTYAGGGPQTVTVTVTDGRGGSATATVSATPTDPPANRAPTARITGVSCSGLTCSFDGSASSDPDSDTLTYLWDFGDGTTSTAANPSRTYSSAEQRTVVLTVSDGRGLSATDSVTVDPTVPANAAPTAAITGVSCADLTCSVNGGTSTDPEDDPLSYGWTWGDGAASTGVTASHTYATAGARTVTLTVTDSSGNTATDTKPVNPTDPPAAPVSNVAFVAALSTNANRLNHSTPIPAGVQVGDTLLAFFTANSTAAAYTFPTGWTPVEALDGNGVLARAWTRTATAADVASGAKVSVTSAPQGNSTGYVKSDLTVAAYRGTDGAGPISASASKVVNTSGATHTSPAVNAPGDTGWLVTYWADKADSTTGFTSPAGHTVRGAVPNPTSSGTGHVTALLADSNGPVSAGQQGQLTATANSTSSRGVSFSVVLKSS